MNNDEFKTRLSEAQKSVEKLQTKFDHICSLIKQNYTDFETYHTALSFLFPPAEVYQVMGATLFLLDVEPGMLQKAHQYVKAVKG